MLKLTPAVLAAVFVSGCVSTPPAEVLSFHSPAEASVGIRDTHHHNIIGNYNHRTAVDPRNWRQLNEEQTPKKGAGS